MKSKFYVLLALFALYIGVCEASDKPNSKFGGVQIGAITYSYRWMPEATIPAIADQVAASGVSSIELMGFPVEEYVGIPGGTTLKPFKKKGDAVCLYG